jgi:CHASE2 domain-containing sensor protein
MSIRAPYVGLDYFLEEDADLFFGRDAERKRIIGNLRAARLTLLYAESGVGKSSLLRAGVSARLRQLAASRAAGRGSARFVPVVFSRWRGDWRADLIAALEAAARPLLPEDAELALRRDALEGAIEDVIAAVDATPLLILDQFEEHFLYDADDDGFDNELADCINRSDLRANFLISIREDAYPLIGPRFKARIPNVYGNYLHLDFLDIRAARDAVLEPVKAFNGRLGADERRFAVEDPLVDAVLEQVRRGRVSIGEDGASDVGAGDGAGVETAYLQLVMKRLWDEEVAAGSQRLRLETLRRLGGADAIVHAHLDDVMAELPADQRDAAAAAFRFLVTSGGRKMALSSEELQEFSDAPAAPLEPALEHLERERILRPIPSSEPGGIGRREIYHDVLAPAILEWRRRHVDEERTRGLAQARERARRLEVRNRRLSAAVVALVVVAASLALYLWDPGAVQRLELRTVDTRFSVRGASAPDPRLVLIAVDDKTLARRGTSPSGNLRRLDYARILDRLRRDGPRVIAIDVVFEDAVTPRGDRALLDAIRATRDRLVLPFWHFTVVQENGGRVVRPQLLGSQAFHATGVQTGYAGLPLDKDARNRRADYQVVIDPTKGIAASGIVTAPTFAFAAADVARAGALRRDLARLPTASRRVDDEAQSTSTTWIDFRGPPETVRPVSALDLLEGRLARGTFRNKVVVVGLTAPHAKLPKGLPRDVHRTPMDRGVGMSGPEVQANALDTMLRGAPLRDVSQLIDILAILVLASVPAMAGLIRSRALAAAAIAAAALIYVALVQIAFHGGWILAVVVPMAALVASALAVATLAATRAARRRRAVRNKPVERAVTTLTL